MAEANKDLRVLAFSKGIRLWQIAEKLGICESKLSRLLRHQLTEEQRAAFTNAVDQLSLRG